MTIEWPFGDDDRGAQRISYERGSVLFKGDAVLVSHIIGKDKQMFVVDGK